MDSDQTHLLRAVWSRSKTSTSIIGVNSYITLSLPQAIIIGFANNIDPGEKAHMPMSRLISSESTLFDIQSFNFMYKFFSSDFCLKETNVV